MSEPQTRPPQLHVLLSQADAARFGLPDAGHTTLPVSEAVQTGILSSLFSGGFVGVEVPADFRGDEVEIPSGRLVRSIADVRDVESVFMFRHLTGG